MTKKIGVLVGSLRKASINRLLAETILSLFPDGYEGRIVEIGDLPLYSEDIDGETPPESYRSFRKELSDFDAFLFVSPEYNRSYTAAIKNAIDVGSRPYGKNLFDGKPGAVVTSSPGAIGGFGANHHLRQTLVFLNVALLQQPEMYLGGILDKIENGKLNEATIEYLKTFVDAYIKHVDRY